MGHVYVYTMYSIFMWFSLLFIETKFECVLYTDTTICPHLKQNI